MLEVNPLTNFRRYVLQASISVLRSFHLFLLGRSPDPPCSSWSVFCVSSEGSVPCSNIYFQSFTNSLPKTHRSGFPLDFIQGFNVLPANGLCSVLAPEIRK